MSFIYNFTLLFASQFLKLLAFFNLKMKLFVAGRKSVFQTLQNKIHAIDKTIWFHAASLGEYEQGLPVIEKVKAQFPNHKIIITFFSPSGYEVRKNNTVADVTVYLPLDTISNAKQFLKLVHPEMVFFIKYEYWPNYLNELKNQNIKTYLISGIFRENQTFFKWYGGFYRKALRTFTYFFVQNETSKKLLQSIGFENVKISGDTRFDRVVTILEKDNTLDFIAAFKNNLPTIVIGSSWPKDEELLIHFINHASNDIKFIIAPHTIDKNQISDKTAYDMWWHYPVFKLGSYDQITNNIRYPPNPDEGTCLPASMCGALYHDKIIGSNYVKQLPPVNPDCGNRIGYFDTDINLQPFRTNVTNILY